MNRRWLAFIAIAFFIVVPIAGATMVDVFMFDAQTRVLARQNTIDTALAQPAALTAPDLHRGPPATS